MRQLHHGLCGHGAREGARVLDLGAVNLQVVTSDQPEPAVDGRDGRAGADHPLALLPYHRVRTC